MQHAFFAGADPRPLHTACHAELRCPAMSLVPCPCRRSARQRQASEDAELEDEEEEEEDARRPRRAAAAARPNYRERRSDDEGGEEEEEGEDAASEAEPEEEEEEEESSGSEGANRRLCRLLPPLPCMCLRMLRSNERRCCLADCAACSLHATPAHYMCGCAPNQPAVLLLAVQMRRRKRRRRPPGGGPPTAPPAAAARSARPRWAGCCGRMFGQSYRSIWFAAACPLLGVRCCCSGPVASQPGLCCCCFGPVASQPDLSSLRTNAPAGRAAHGPAARPHQLQP